VARSAVIEELREVIRRTKEPSSWTPVETVHADGDVTSIIDRAENRDAARRYGCVKVGQTQVLRDLVYRDLLGKLLSTENCSDEDIELLKTIHAEDLTAGEIAEQRGMTRDEVLRRVRRARRRLREIAKVKYLFTVEDL
jgi:DNA-directed RNA polymerase specialized sigma24 family protein